MSRKIIWSCAVIILSTAPVGRAYAEDSQPVINVTPLNNGGNLYTPGANQPVVETHQGNTTHLDYDQPAAPNSRYEVTPNTNGDQQ